MKDIQESLKGTRSISERIDESRVDEGLRDIFNAVKAKFKQAFKYLKGVVAKVGTYFVTFNAEGKVEPVISPLTSGQAYKDGIMNASTSLVVMDGEGEQIVKLGTKLKDATKLYGRGNSIDYWDRMVTECEKLEKERGEVINEVKLNNEDPEAKYAVIEDGKELEEEILMHIHNPKLPKLLIWGAPGIGKTAIVMSVISAMQKENKKYQCIFKTLSNETPDNFTLPKYIQIDDQDFATDVPKTWLPVYKPSGNKTEDAKLDKKCGSGLLFVDELSRATPQVLNVVLPLVNEGEFNGYKLGSGWTIVCASNRAEDETSGQSSIGNALANRFSQVWFEPSFKTWKKWAEKQNFISPLILQWLSLPESENMSGAKFYYMDPNEDMDGSGVTSLMCTPRSWTNAMRTLAEYSRTGTLEGFSLFDIPDRIICRALNQTIPASAIDSLMGFLQVIKGIGNFDAAVEDIWKNGGKGFKIDKKVLNKIILPLAQLVCSAHADKLPTEKEFENLGKWLVSMGSEQLTSYTLDVFKEVFFGELPEDLRNGAIVLQLRRQKSPDTVAPWKTMFAPWEKRWGIKMEDMPDYNPGRHAIMGKFKDVFKNTMVDGVEAFG